MILLQLIFLTSLYNCVWKYDLNGSTAKFTWSKGNCKGESKHHRKFTLNKERRKLPWKWIVKKYAMYGISTIRFKIKFIVSFWYKIECIIGCSITLLEIVFLKVYAVCYYCIPSWGLSKYIDTKLQTTCFYLILSIFLNKKKPGTSLFALFSA